MTLWYCYIKCIKNPELSETQWTLQKPKFALNHSNSPINNSTKKCVWKCNFFVGEQRLLVEMVFSCLMPLKVQFEQFSCQYTSIENFYNSFIYRNIQRTMNMCILGFIFIFIVIESLMLTLNLSTSIILYSKKKVDEVNKIQST
jgi:hypothetical protein